MSLTITNTNIKPSAECGEHKTATNNEITHEHAQSQTNTIVTNKTTVPDAANMESPRTIITTGKYNVELCDS